MSRYILFIISLFTSVTSNAETLHQVSGESPPYISKNLKHQGFIVDLVTKALAKSDIKLDNNFAPWTRASDLVKKGEYEASLMWVKKKDREKSVIYSVPIFSTTNMFFYKKSKPIEWIEYEDLKKYRMAYTQGYSYGEFDSFIDQNKANFQEVRDELQLFKMLKAGRLDAFPMDLEIGYYYLRNKFPKEYLEQISHHQKSAMRESLHVIFSKNMDKEKRKRMMRAIRKGITEMKNSGELSKMLLKLRDGYYELKD